jgi:hypothetical protein
MTVTAFRPQDLAVAEGVGELLSHCGRGCGGGEGENQGGGEENLLHERSPIWGGLLTERLQPAGRLSD